MLKAIEGFFKNTNVSLNGPGLGFIRPGASDDANFQYPDTLRGVIIEESGQLVATGVDGNVETIKVYAGQQIDCLISRVVATGTTCVWVGIL